MERGKRSEAINSQIQLPEAIIQHIQSLLDGKQAAQTSVISKSWYNAWLTTPNLDFDQRNFEKRRIGDSESEPANRFANFVKKTMQRYQELNLNIVKFRLWMRVGKPDWVSLANESIMKALRMGVIDLNLEFPSYFYEMYALPHEVFEAETLIRLSVIGCKIDRLVDRKVLCSRLESLSLSKDVCVENDVVWNIISSCPLIENLLLSECKYVVESPKILKQSTKILTLRSPLIEYRKRNVGSVVDGPIKVSDFHKLKSLLLQRSVVDGPIKASEFHKLKSLLLQNVNVDRRFFCDFSFKFPCLEDLSLHHCYGYNGREEISGHSLKCISLTEISMWMKFDAPNIRKLIFSGKCFSRLSFTSALKECESHISILCSSNHVKASWFRELKRFLTRLTPSIVTLSLGFFREPILGFIREQHMDHLGEMEGLTRPVLENLILSEHSESPICSAFLDGLFWSCRPKVITVNGFPGSHVLEKAHNELVELLWRRLIQQVNENCCVPNQNVFGQHGLEEVYMEYFEESLTEWKRSLPFARARIFGTTLFCASTSPQYGQKVRFRLKWGPFDGAGDKPKKKQRKQ